MGCSHPGALLSAALTSKSADRGTPAALLSQLGLLLARLQCPPDLLCGTEAFFFFYTSKFFILLFQLIPIACFFFICTSAVRSSVVSVNKRVKGGLEPFCEFKWGRERCDSEHNGKTMTFLQGENTKRHSVSSFLFLWHLHTQVGWTWGLSSYTEITNICPN